MTSSSSTESPSAAYLAALAEAFAGSATAGLSEHDLRIAGARIRVSVAGSGLRAMLAPLMLEAAEDAPLDGVVRVWDDASTRSRLPAFPWERTDVGRQGAIDGWNTPQLRTVYHGNVMEPPLYGFNALSLFDAETRTSFFWAADKERLPWAESLEPLRPSFHWLLGGLGAHMIHAGAVATANGAAVLAGAGFAGKTTTAMACVQAGMSFVGDNYIVLTLGNGEPVVHCLYPNIKLREDSLQLLPGLTDLVTAGDRAVFDVRQSRPTQIAASSPARAVLIVRRGSGTTRIVPAPPSAALTALAPSTIYQLPGNDGSGLKAIGDLLRSVPSFFLNVGPSPSTAAPVISHLLAQL